MISHTTSSRLRNNLELLLLWKIEQLIENENCVLVTTAYFDKRINATSNQLRGRNVVEKIARNWKFSKKLREIYCYSLIIN